MFIEVTNDYGLFKINVLHIIRYVVCRNCGEDVNTTIELSNGAEFYIHETVEVLELKIEQAMGKSKSIWEE